MKKKRNKVVQKKNIVGTVFKKLKGGELAIVGKRGIVEGRPLMWKDPKKFKEAVDEYFDNVKNKHTWTGLALYLGFVSRQSLYEYKERSEFSEVVQYALLRIENKYEEKIMGNGNPIGGIFALKNMDWKDKQEVKHIDQPNTAIQINIIKANKDED